MEGDHAGVCRTCGTVGRGLLFDQWVRETFTDQDKLRDGQIVCHACQFCFTDRNEPLTRLTGKPKLQRMRNYSHFVSRGVWTPVSKGDKRLMRDLLAGNPQLAVIAESGQKHILFRAKPGWWQFEEQSVRPFPVELEALLVTVEALYGGFAKSEIGTGHYAQHRILKFGFERWLALENAIKKSRGTIRLDMALFLAQREESDDDDSADS